jgi:hypothetical protein
MARALSAPRAKLVMPCTRCAQAGVMPHGPASLAMGRARPGQLGSVAGRARTVRVGHVPGIRPSGHF